MKILDFGRMQELFLFLIFILLFLGFVWQKPNFHCNKTTKIGLRKSFSKHTLKQKIPSKKQLQAKQDLNLLT